MLPAQLWKTRDRRSDSYLSECPLTCLHSFKIQIFCFIKWKSVSFDEKNLCFSEILAGFWRIYSNESRHEHETWDMDMRHEHEIWDMDMRHGHGTWDMDMRHETWIWDMNTKLKVRVTLHAPVLATFITCSLARSCTTICQLLCLVQRQDELIKEDWLIKMSINGWLNRLALHRYLRLSTHYP